MRITLTRIVYLALFLVLIVCLVHLVVRNNQVANNLSCLHTPAYQARLNYLASKIHLALKLLDVTHFVCRETLWAGLYNEGARSWDQSVEICLMEKDFYKNDEKTIHSKFNEQGLLLNYDYMEGTFNVELSGGHESFTPSLAPHERDVVGVLNLFQVVSSEESSMLMKHNGWKRKLLPSNCETESLECFPSALAQPPLSSIRFGSVSLPAPREGLEIQKYHYPHDWWIQRKIPSC